MKKIFPILIALFFVLPLINASAYSDGFSSEYPQYKNPGYQNLFDGDLTSFSNIGANSYISPFINLPLLTVTSIRVSPGSLNGSLGFYDSSNSLIKSVNLATYSTTNWVNITPIQNVSFIRISNSSSSELLKINEFDIKATTKEVVKGESVINLSETHNHNSTILSWENPVSGHIESIIIKSNGIEVASLANTAEAYSFTNLNPETLYNLEVIVKYTDGALSSSEKITVTTDAVPVDTKPPSEITNLTFDVNHAGSSFSWINPIDTDFSHVKVYRDGFLIGNEIKLTKFNVTDLIPNTIYVFKFVAVDNDGNSSQGYIQTVKTNKELDNVAPSSPIKLSVKVGNQAGNLFWDDNKESDLKGYNVYVNGIKHNSAVLLKNHYVLTGLENDETYSITVTAVDTSGNESLFSTAVLLSPSKSAMPIIKTEMDLKDVAYSTSNWFSTLWPIIAFAVGILLAFMVSNRVKTLFLG